MPSTREAQTATWSPASSSSTTCDSACNGWPRNAGNAYTGQSA